MENKPDISRWTKALAVFALAGFALWRSIVYVDPNPQYPALASLMCGVWAVSLVLTALGIVTENPPD